MPLPKRFFQNSDWLESDAVRVYAGNTGHAMERANQIARAYADKFVWEFPDREVLFFCDLHADAEAFLRSLVACQAIVCHSKDLLDFDLTPRGQTADIVIAGDIFDKGPSNLHLLDLLTHLRTLGANLKILAGNHDLRIWLTLKALDATEQGQIDYLAEHLERAQLLVREVLDRAVTLLPPLGKKTKARHKKAGSKKAAAKSHKVFQQLFGLDPDRNGATSDRPGAFSRRPAWLEEQWQQITSFYRERGIEPEQLYNGLLEAYDLLVPPSGAYGWLFQEMQLMLRYGSFLLVHGGVDDTLCAQLAGQGLDGINREFRTRLAAALPRELIAGPFGNCTLTKYRPSDEALTSEGVRQLHAEGILAIVHGHDNQVGQQNIAYRQELLHFQCDASLNRCTRELQGLPTKGMAVVVFEPQGKLTAFSGDYPAGKSFTPARSRTAPQRFFRALLKSFRK